MTADELLLLKVIEEYKALKIGGQIDYDKFYLYSLITHSTAIEGSTVTELENRLLFDEGIAAKGRSMTEQLMNLDLKAAYEESLKRAKAHTSVGVDMLKQFSSLVMKNTGAAYNTALGSFDSSKGDLRLLNVTAGAGGQSYFNFHKVPQRLADFCQWLNAERTKIDKNNIIAAYHLSFEAHYLLVTIHPWVDGNGRMARLVMNYLQFEYGLIPSKISKDDKAAYIQALQTAREQDDAAVFHRFMLAQHTAALRSEIEEYKKSQQADVVIKDKNVVINVVINETEKQVFNLLQNNPQLSANALAAQLQMSARQVQRVLAALKSKNLIARIGSNKNGKWEVI